MLYRQIKTNDRLRLRIEQLQDLRLQDAREMTRVIEATTAATEARATNDLRYQGLLQEMFLRFQSTGAPTIPPAPQVPLRSP
jgi:hypothetical protein